MNKTKKRYLLIVVITLIIEGLLLILLPNYNTHTIYPVNDLSGYEIGTYHEDLDSNWSQAKFDIVDNKIEFSYRLTKRKEEPFAAFYFRHADITKKIVDLERFNSISIKLKAEHAQRIPITLRFHNESYINLSKKFPEVSITTVVDYVDEGIYKIPLNQFEIAAWWLRYHGIEKDVIDLKKITQLKYLAIGSCQALEPGLSDTITISDITFYNDVSNFYLVSAFILVFVLIFLFIHWKINTKPQKTIVVKPIVIEDQKSEVTKIDEVKLFIANNYHNPDLTMHNVQKDVKLSAAELRKIFKENLQGSFKNYLKTVRLAEVKRLLQENDELTISEIAYKCGFGDIPYFNRLFKSELGTTPKQYRSGNPEK